MGYFPIVIAPLAALSTAPAVVYYMMRFRPAVARLLGDGPPAVEDAPPTSRVFLTQALLLAPALVVGIIWLVYLVGRD